MRIDKIEDVLDKLATGSRNNALDTAAKVAKLYGASDEVCERILMLKAPVKERTDA